MTTPYYTDDHVVLYLGDALEVLRNLADASVGCVVTSRRTTAQLGLVAE